MKVITLLENTAIKESLVHAHGLSLYIETPQHKILFDMGPDASFLKNAKELGVDISAVDIAFLSHGHSDHSGGLAAFCQCNRQASIYLHKAAFGAYYAVDGEKTTYIGMDPALRQYESRLIFCDADRVIDDELQLFSDIRTKDYPSGANATLRQKEGNALPAEDFRHEQNLLITAEGKRVLVAGCAHRGIVNIQRRAEELLDGTVDAVFAGFHLYNPGTKRAEPESLVAAVAEELGRRPTTYYTGHCTGPEAYVQLKACLQEQVNYMAGGMVMTV